MSGSHFTSMISTISLPSNPSFDFSIVMITAYHFPFLCRSTALSGDVLHKYSGTVPYCFCTYLKISSVFTTYSTPDVSDVLPIIIPHFRIPNYLVNSFAILPFFLPFLSQEINNKIALATHSFFPNLPKVSGPFPPR